MNKLNKQNQHPQFSQTTVSKSALLTKKTKKDFEMFIFRQKGTLPKGIESYNYYDLQNSYIISDIIYWFDSIEFYINIKVIKNKMLTYVRGFDSEVTLHFQGDLITINSDCLKNDIYNTRNEAVLKAIQKASELYNTKFF